MRRFMTDKDLVFRWSVVAPVSVALGFLFVFSMFLPRGFSQLLWSLAPRL